MPLSRANPIIPQPSPQSLNLPEAFISQLSAFNAFRVLGSDAPLTVAGTSFPVASVITGHSILVVGRVQGNAATINVGVRLNNDSANNYGFFNIFSAGAGVNDGASAVTNFLQAGQATNTTSCAFGCLIPGHKVGTLTNVPAFAFCASAAINLLRAAWWNQTGPVNQVQVVADAAMAPGSFAAIYLLG